MKYWIPIWRTKSVFSKMTVTSDKFYFKFNTVINNYFLFYRVELYR